MPVITCARVLNRVLPIETVYWILIPLLSFSLKKVFDNLRMRKFEHQRIILVSIFGNLDY